MRLRGSELHSEFGDADAFGAQLVGALSVLLSLPPRRMVFQQLRWLRSGDEVEVRVVLLDELASGGGGEGGEGDEGGPVHLGLATPTALDAAHHLAELAAHRISLASHTLIFVHTDHDPPSPPSPPPPSPPPPSPPSPPPRLAEAQMPNVTSISH